MNSLSRHCNRHDEGVQLIKAVTAFSRQQPLDPEAVEIGHLIGNLAMTSPPFVAWGNNRCLYGYSRRFGTCLG